METRDISVSIAGLNTPTPYVDKDISLVKAGRSAGDNSDRKKLNYLYCIVFPTHKNPTQNEKLSIYRQSIIDRITSAGLVIDAFYSVQRDEIYVKIGASDERLLFEADYAEFNLQLEPDSIRKIATSNKDEDRKPIYLEPPYDKSQLFGSYDAKTDTLTPYSDDQIHPYILAQTKLNPFDYLYAPYSQLWETDRLAKHGVQIYKTYPDKSILRPTERMKLIQMALERSSKITSETKFRGAGLKIGKMLYDDKILAAFPYQGAAEMIDSKSITVDELFSRWSHIRKMPWTQPIDDIRDYFGEKIAIYFAFLGHYTFWLFPAGIVGLAIFIAQMKNVSDNIGQVTIFNVSKVSEDKTKTIVYTDIPVSPFYALFVSLWATLMLEYWKREQSRFALRYGMVGYESNEFVRPEFIPSHFLPNPVTGKRDPFLSEMSIIARLGISTSVILTCITIVIAAVAGIFVLKVFLTLPDKAGFDETVGGYVALIINAIVIQLLAYLYKKIAKVLNDLEDHKTDTRYEDSLIAKTYIFSFVNSYSTLFYMAFVKSNIEILGIKQYCNVQARAMNATDACFGDLGSSLFIIFCTQILINNSIEVIFPYFQTLWTKRSNTKISSHMQNASDSKKYVPLRSPAEDLFFLQTYEGTLGDFLELAIQFGYATMFVTAFPLAPFLAFINNWLEIRVDSFKLCKLCRRPDMQGAEDIGTWQFIFETVSFVAVVTNASVIAFTSNVVEDFIVYTKKGIDNVSALDSIHSIKDVESLLVWTFAIFVAIVFTIKFIVQYIVSDVPAEVKIQLQRNEYLVEKCIKGEKDEDEDEEEDQNAEGQQINQPGSSTLTKKGSFTRFNYVVKNVDSDIDSALKRLATAINQKLDGGSPESLFERINKDNSKGIDHWEFIKFLHDDLAVGSMITKEETYELLKSIDVNNDGSMNISEFIALIKNSS